MLTHFKKNRGFTLTEIMVVLGIVAILASVFIATLAGSKGADNVDRVVQQIYDDIISMRSKAVSANKNHRINFLSKTSWKTEYYEDTTNTWIQVGEARSMPGDTYLTDSSFTNAGSNLQATPRGLFVFGGTTIGTPYITVNGLGATTTKSLHVYVGGAIDKQTP